MIHTIKDTDNTFKNLLNGKWILDKDNLITINSPLDNSVIGKVKAMSKEDVDKAIEGAKVAQRSWNNVPLNERCEILYKAADILLQNQEELTDLMVMEIGKDRASAKSEVVRTADFIRI